MSIEPRLQRLNAYLAACERLDIPAIVGCFEQAGSVVDPLGEQNGHEAIRTYFDGIYRDLAALSFDAGLACWCGASCALSWKGSGRRHDGSSVAYEGVDVFTFGPDHRIRELWAFWVPQDLLGSDSLG